MENNLQKYPPPPLVGRLNNSFITWLSRLNLYVWTSFLLYRIFDTLLELRNHMPTVDEYSTYIFVENVLRFGRFRAGLMPTSINYNPDAPIHIYLTYTLEMILRLPFHILSHLFDDPRITKLAPAIYLVVFLIIFIPRITKKGMEEYALVVGISFALLATMRTVANAFFRIRYFAFLYISVFICAIFFAHLYSKALSPKRIILMICFSIIPILFHPYAIFMAAPMLLLICIKVFKEKQLTFRKIWDMLRATKLVYIICIITGLLALIYFGISVLLPNVMFVVNYSDWFSLSTLREHVSKFTGPRLYHILGYAIIVLFIVFQNKKLSDFLRALFFVSVGSLVFSSLTAFVTGNHRLAINRYDVLGNVFMSIILAIFIILLVQNIFSLLNGKQGISKIFHKDSIKIEFSSIAIAAAIFLSAATSGYKSHTHHLPIIFADHYAQLTHGISYHDIAPENLIIISDNNIHLYNQYPQSRIFFARATPSDLDLMPGERTGYWVITTSAWFRDYNGWLYDRRGRAWLGTIEDWYRLLTEINEDVAGSRYIALGWRHDRGRFIEGELTNLFRAINMPEDYTPIPLSDIINRMYANDFYVPEHLRFLVYS